MTADNKQNGIEIKYDITTRKAQFIEKWADDMVDSMLKDAEERGEEDYNPLYNEKHGYNRKYVELKLKDAVYRIFNEKINDVEIDVDEVHSHPSYDGRPTHDYGDHALVYEVVVRPPTLVDVFAIEEESKDISALRNTIKAFENKEYFKHNQKAKLIVNALSMQLLDDDPITVETGEVYHDVLEAVRDLEYCYNMDDNTSLEITKAITEALTKSLSKDGIVYLTVDQRIIVKLQKLGTLLIAKACEGAEYTCKYDEFIEWATSEPVGDTDD